jgi:hypothetical protein
MVQADSGPPVYETEIPEVPSETKKHNSIDEPGAEKSNDGGNKASDTPETGDESESTGGGVGNQGSGGGNGGGGSAGKDGGTGQGSPGNGSSGGQDVGLGQGTQVANTQAADDGGSSSPLVPILIAIAALAAISIGAFVIRQRRQRDGSGGQVSPKAS